MPVPKSIRRLNRRQSELRREQLRHEQFRRERLRAARRREAEFRGKCLDTLKGTLFIVAILAFFAMIYWLAVSELLPTGYWSGYFTSRP